MSLSEASFLPDGKDCAETWREQRWSEGVRCVRCGSDQVQCRTERYRAHLCRYQCQACGKWFNDLSDTPLEYSKVSLNRWIYLMRELDKGRSVAAIAPRDRRHLQNGLAHGPSGPRAVVRPSAPGAFKR